MKKLFSVLLAALMLFGSILTVAAAEDTDAKTSVIFTDDFIMYANVYVRNKDLLYNKDNISDYITVYYEAGDTAVFSVKTEYKGEYRQLIDGYVFTSEYSMWKSSNSSIFVYKDKTIVPILSAVNNGWFTANRLAQLVPGTVKLSEKDMFGLFKLNGYEMTDLVYLGDNLCYAFNRNMPSPDADLDFSIKDFEFHMDSRLAPNALGLFYLTLDGVSPVYEEERDFQSYDVLPLIRIIRAAEEKGCKFHFTVKNKFGDEAENCRFAVNEQLYSFDMWLDSFGKLGDLYVCKCSTNHLCSTLLDFKIGKYLYKSAAPHELKTMGLYIVRDDKAYTINDAYDKGIITDADDDSIVAITGLSGCGWNAYKLSDIENKFADYLKTMGRSYGYYGDSFKKLGEVDGCTLYSENDYFTDNGKVSYFGYEVRFNGGSGSLGIVVYKDGRFITVEEALDNGTINSGNVADFIKVIKNREHVKVIAPDEKYPELKKAIMKANPSIRSSDEIEINYCYSLSNGMQLFNYSVSDWAYTADMCYTPIGKYLLTESSSGKNEYIYGNKLGITTVKAAYESGSISDKLLDEIASKLKNMTLNRLSVKAGEESGYFNLRDIKSVKSSAPKIARVTNRYYVTGLTKGTATITYTFKNGAKATCKLSVLTNPRLTKNGKTIKAVTVRKGGTVKVRVAGKADAVKNTYKNTKYARVVSARNAKVLEIKGLRRTKATTVKIEVNGKVLPLKVKVK